MTSWLGARRLRLEPLWVELREPLTLVVLVVFLLAMIAVAVWVDPTAGAGVPYLARKIRASIDRWFRHAPVATAAA